MTLAQMILASQKKQTYFVRVVSEKTAKSFGEIITTSKNPKYKGMTIEEFSEATKYESCFTSEVRKITN